MAKSSSTPTERPPHVVRDLAEPDFRFVLKSWLRVARRAPEFRRMPPATFFAHFNAVARRILEHPRTVGVAAVRPHRPELIYSFLVLDPGLPLLHMVYTEGHWRTWGYARDLARHVGFDYRESFGFTFPTFMTGRLLRGRPHAVYMGPAGLEVYR